METAGKGVNVPLNPRLKEQDVNMKLQLYGIYSAFANGKVPSNKQIDVAMNSALEWEQLRNPSKRLSSEGQVLVRDLRDVIEKAKILLLTKNRGDLIQDFIWQTQMIGTGNASLPNAPVDKDTAKQHGSQALDGLRTLGELLITNGQFRKLLSDASILLRDMVGDAATTVANKVNPSDEQLQQMDRPAEDNVWHEKPDFSRDNLKQQIQSRIPIGKKDVQDTVGDATQAAHPEGSRDPRDAADLAARDQQQGTSSGINAAAGVQAGAQQIKDKVDANTKEDTKQRTREYREKTVNYFKQKMPQERREQIIFRLKKMIVEIQGHQDYEQAIDTLLRLAEEYTGHTKNLAGQSKDAVKGVHEQDTLQTAEADLKTLLERFANHTSFDDLFDSINQIYADADRDPELKNWFKDIDRYIRKCLMEQGYILQDESNERWNQLYDHGNFLLRDRYRNHTDRIADELKFLAGQFDEDPQNRAFADAMNKLFLDLGNDENGKPTFKPHLVKDLTEVILPGFFESVRYVPIPRIEYSDHMIDAIVENLVIEGDNLAPNLFEFGSDNYWRWGRKGVQSRSKNKVMLAVSGVQMDLRDVSYYVKKKQGFPGITDKGVMDVFMGGSGLTFKVAMETADASDRHHFFKINSVTVEVKNLNIKVKQSNHKLLFALFKPTLLGVMRPVIQKVAEKQIRENVAQLDAFLYRIKQEADRAQQEALENPDPEHIQNMYQRYLTAAQHQFQRGRKKVQDIAADKKVNMAITQHDSIFQNISLPGGISTKATEYKELAAKGDKWQSPVFSIGSAQETSNLPPVGETKRKPHNVTQGGLRGPGTGDYTTNGNLSGQPGYGNQGAYGTHGTQGTLGNQGVLGTESGYGNQGTLGNRDPIGNPTAFANQVNTAFQGDKSQDLGLTRGGVNGPSTGTAGVTGAGSEHTTLGRENPVLRGQV